MCIIPGILLTVILAIAPDAATLAFGTSHSSPWKILIMVLEATQTMEIFATFSIHAGKAYPVIPTLLSFNVTILLTAFLVEVMVLTCLK